MLLVIFGYEFSIKKQASEYETPYSNKNVERDLREAKKETEIKKDDIIAESNSQYSFKDNILYKNSSPMGISQYANLIIQSEGKDITIVSDSDVTIEGGFVGNIKAGGDVHCESEVTGNIEAGGDVSCDGSITGNISANGDFNGEDITGGVTCNGEMSCSSINGSESVTCAGELNVDGDITSQLVKGNDINCNDITGNIECNELECHGDITGNITAKGALRV
jgi:cytoskeletal protein CcmA (bactofilin family)